MCGRLALGAVLFAGLLANPAAAQRQMVAAAHPLAAEAGLAVLRAGGNALDAAVATQAMLNVVEPDASGFGGGALLLHWDAATRSLSAWDGRETAPAAATSNLFVRDGQPMRFAEAYTGGRAVGVPGALRMLDAAHRSLGRQPWPTLFAAAIATAEDGFPITPRLAGSIARQADRLRADAGARAAFLPGGMPPPPGTRLRNTPLATTLRAFAEQGGDALHRGPIAADIVTAVRAHPSVGLLTTDDLAGYAPRRREAVCTAYRATTVCGFPPPSSGGVAVAQILAVLAHQEVGSLDPRGLDAAHLLGEAGRIAFADRNRYLADADQVPVPVRGLLDPAYLTGRAQLLDRDRALALVVAGNPPWAASRPLSSQPAQTEGGTSHVSIVDAAGNVVAMTTTVEAGFGAGLVVRGLVLNNELTDFAFSPELDGRPVANRVAPGKRPRSSMSPTIVFDSGGLPILALGSAGGSRIIGHVAQSLVALLDWGLEPQAAVGLPRVAARDGLVELEAGTQAAALAEPLRARGFPVDVVNNISGLHVIRIQRGPDGVRLTGGADPRRDGVVAAD